MFALTSMTFFAPVLERRDLTSVRIVGAVIACSARNPPWPWTPEGTPGKSVVFSAVRGMLASVRSDRLQIRQIHNRYPSTRNTYSCVGSVP